MNDSKFLGICIVIASGILSGSIVWSATNGTTQFVPNGGPLHVVVVGNESVDLHGGPLEPVAVKIESPEKAK